jgi:hypothetical protein
MGASASFNGLIGFGLIKVNKPNVGNTAIGWVFCDLGCRGNWFGVSIENKLAHVRDSFNLNQKQEN